MKLSQQTEASPSADSPSDPELDFSARQEATREKYENMKPETPVPAEPQSEPEVDPNDPGEKPEPEEPSEEKTEEKPRAESGKFTLTRKQVNQWIQDNPRDANRLFPDTEAGVKNQHISLSRKRQKFESFREEQETAFTTRSEKLDAQEKAGQEAIDAAIAQVRPGSDLLQALASKDYAAVDAAFDRAGVKYDDWTKQRMRAGVDSVRKSAESLRIKELEKEIADSKLPKAKAKKDDETPAEEKAPAYSVATIEAEVDEDHAVREVANWEKKVQKLTADEDDEVSIEDAANTVLKAARKKMGLTDDDEPAKPKSKRSVRESAPAEDELDFEARMRRVREGYEA